MYIAITEIRSAAINSQLIIAGFEKEDLPKITLYNSGVINQRGATTVRWQTRMASNINNNTIRENGNNKRHVNLTMDDVPNGTINDTINLLLRAGNRTDLDKLLFFVQSPGLIGGDEFLQWASNADPSGGSFKMPSPTSW